MKNDFRDLILLETDDFIVVNKPPMVASLNDRVSPDNMLARARTYSPDSSLCHRLDKETSGVLIVSKNEIFYKYFAGLLENRAVHKLYHAVVDGQPRFLETEVSLPISVSTNRSRIDPRGGKPSVTLFETLKTYHKHSLVACMPFTGRTHQIRIHLQEMGFPITGDHKYGGKDILLSDLKRNYKIGRGKVERPLIQRFALHAAGLRFRDSKGKSIDVTAPYPKDFEVLIRQLEKNSG